MEEGHSHEIWGGDRGGGALEFVDGLMVVGYGEVLVKGGKVSLGICLLWWGMVLVFFFGMISGLGIFLLKFFILSYFCVQLVRRLVFLMCYALRWVIMTECGV